jgi:uncharacterized membrane protein YdbT with pleckstrin-like domain
MGKDKQKYSRAEIIELIKFSMHLLVLTIILIGTAIGGLYFIYGFMTCTIVLIPLILILFGFAWVLEYGYDYNDDDDDDDNK